MSEKLYLIDGMAMVYKAYFSMISRPLINSKGKNTSAVYGFLNSLLKILDDEKPEYLGICFDTDAQTFRHEEYDLYKANRFQAPTDMAWQIIMLKEIIKAMNIPMLELHKFEADDIIGTLVKRAEKENVINFMVTPDKDFMQLVTEKTFLYKPQRSIHGNKISEVEIVDIEGVKNKFGVEPGRVIDVLGLMGDSSDNIPGVKGVGEKTAIMLIQKFGTIEDIYNNIDQVDKPRLKELLITNKDNAFLSKRLVTIHCDVPIDCDFHTLIKKEPDTNRLIPLLNELEFKSLIRRFSSDKKTVSSEPEWPPKDENETQVKSPESDNGLPKKVKKVNQESTSNASIKVNITEEKKVLKTIKDVKHSYYTIKDNKQLDKLVKQLLTKDLIAFDTETDSTDCMICKLVGLSFAFNEFEAFYIPVLFNEAEENKDLFNSGKNADVKESFGIELKYLIDKIKPLLENNKIRKVGQNIKFDYVIMRNHGIEIENIYFDSLIGAYVLHSDGDHGMDFLSEKYLCYKPIPIVDLIGKAKDKTTLDKLPVEKVSEYAAEDADVTLQLFYRIKYELDKLNLFKLCKEIEFPLVKVLAEIEYTGFRVDEKILSFINKECEILILDFENKIYNAAGEKFNINSTKQLAEILFTKLKLNPLRKTKTGYSTDVRVLEELKYQHEIAALLVEYRMLTKIKSTYLEGLTKAINPKTGKIHTCFNQIVAATGRLSSINPNLQNIPIRTDVGRSIRKAFVASNENYIIMSADYSQIELRIMAHYCKDENMMNAFIKNHDIHSETAMRIFNLTSKKDVTSNMRRKAKEVNFGIIYGIGAFGLARRLEIRNSEAKDIIDRYFAEYPKVREYTQNTIKFARENGFVESLKGRRRYLSQINNQNPTARAEDERAAINMPIQGTAADMIKIAMILIFDEFKKRKLESKMILQVHDELVFEVKKGELELVKEIVLDKMKNAITLDVPIEVETGTGQSWYDTH
jgi:DNA polymerase-1